MSTIPEQIKGNNRRDIIAFSYRIINTFIQIKYFKILKHDEVINLIPKLTLLLRKLNA